MTIHTSKRLLAPLLSILNVLNVSTVLLQKQGAANLQASRPDAAVDPESAVLRSW
jgi:hypothetical protein